MQQIIDLLSRLLEAVLYSAGRFFVDTDVMIFMASHTYAAASAAASVTIELPSHDKGWIIDGIFCWATVPGDFTVDIARSGRGGAHLTSGFIHSTLALPSRATLEQTIIGPIHADSKEVFTFNLVNGATAVNIVKPMIVARKRR